MGQWEAQRKREPSEAIWDKGEVGAKVKVKRIYDIAFNEPHPVG